MIACCDCSEFRNNHETSGYVDLTSKWIWNETQQVSVASSFSINFWIIAEEKNDYEIFSFGKSPPESFAIEKKGGTVQWKRFNDDKPVKFDKTLSNGEHYAFSLIQRCETNPCRLEMWVNKEELNNITTKGRRRSLTKTIEDMVEGITDLFGANYVPRAMNEAEIIQIHKGWMDKFPQSPTWTVLYICFGLIASLMVVGFICTRINQADKPDYISLIALGLTIYDISSDAVLIGDMFSKEHIKLFGIEIWKILLVMFVGSVFSNVLFTVWWFTKKHKNAHIPRWISHMGRKVYVYYFFSALNIHAFRVADSRVYPSIWFRAPLLRKDIDDLRKGNALTLLIEDVGSLIIQIYLIVHVDGIERSTKETVVLALVSSCANIIFSFISALFGICEGDAMKRTQIIGKVSTSEDLAKVSQKIRDDLRKKIGQNFFLECLCVPGERTNPEYKYTFEFHMYLYEFGTDLVDSQYDLLHTALVDVIKKKRKLINSEITCVEESPYHKWAKSLSSMYNFGENLPASGTGVLVKIDRDKSRMEFIISGKKFEALDRIMDLVNGQAVKTYNQRMTRETMIAPGKKEPLALARVDSASLELKGWTESLTEFGLYANSSHVEWHYPRGSVFGQRRTPENSQRRTPETSQTKKYVRPQTSGEPGEIEMAELWFDQDIEEGEGVPEGSRSVPKREPSQERTTLGKPSNLSKPQIDGHCADISIEFTPVNSHCSESNV